MRLAASVSVLPWVVALAAGCSNPGAAEGTDTDVATTGPTGTDGVDVDADDDDDADDDTAGACPAGQTDCAGQCVDTQTDPAACGDCGNACGADEVCVAGSCGVDCGAMTQCGDACVDVQADPDHCGACDEPCVGEAVCTDGECVVTCEEDEVACDFVCVDSSNDESHCGGCGQPCEAGVACVYGECAAADVHHILISGQSLSVGSTSAVVSTEQPYQNVSFNTGVRAGNANLTSFIPLVETQQGTLGETIASGMANLTTELAAASGFAGHVTLASGNGVGGTPYSGLAQGTGPYATGMAQVSAGVSVASAAGLSYRMRAVAVVHGESDHVNASMAYADDVLQWQADYEADIATATGQTGPIPMLLCQVSSHTAYGTPTSLIPSAQLAAARARPDRIFVVGPKYFLTYTDGVHIDGASERWLGEYYAKVVHRVLVEGEPWLPVSPREVTVDGAVVRVEFHVPAPPLVLDTEAVSDPGNFGFEIFDAAAPMPTTIVDVALDGPDAVQITLSAPPNPGARIRYAFTGGAGAPAGPMTGARGNLRDSDDTASMVGNPLWNWAVHFDEPIR